MIWPSSTPGWSVANVTSTAIATSGSWANALVRDPPNPVSSWTTAIAEYIAGSPAGLGDQPGRLGGHVAADPVVERAGQDHAGPELHRIGVDHRDVADPHHRSGLLVVLRPDVDMQILALGNLLALLLAQQVDRLARDHPDESRRSRVLIRTRWPISTITSQPPIGPKRRKPSLSMCVMCRPISSMCPTTIEPRALGLPGHAGIRGADVVGPDVVGEAGAVLPPHLGRCGLVARGSGGGEQPGEEVERHGG